MESNAELFKIVVIHLEVFFDRNNILYLYPIKYFFHIAKLIE